jgi:hypothetical protein
MYTILGGDGKEYGPIPAETLRQWINEGRANALTKVRVEGGTAWVALGQLPEFAPSVNTPPPPMGAPGAISSSVGGPPPGTKIPNYLVQAILVTLCCCLPLGIVAIVYAAQVNSKLAAGDITSAKDSSSKAKMWCWIAFGVGLVANVIIGGIQILALAGRISTGGMLGH